MKKCCIYMVLFHTVCVPIPSTHLNLLDQRPHDDRFFFPSITSSHLNRPIFDSRNASARSTALHSLILYSSSAMPIVNAGFSIMAALGKLKHLTELKPKEVEMLNADIESINTPKKSTTYFKTFVLIIKLILLTTALLDMIFILYLLPTAYESGFLFIFIILCSLCENLMSVYGIFYNLAVFIFLHCFSWLLIGMFLMLNHLDKFSWDCSLLADKDAERCAVERNQMNYLAIVKLVHILLFLAMYFRIRYNKYLIQY